MSKKTMKRKSIKLKNKRRNKTISRKKRGGKGISLGNIFKSIISSKPTVVNTSKPIIKPIIKPIFKSR